MPVPVKVCCRWLRAHALRTEGLFRRPGSGRKVNAYIEQFNLNPLTPVPEDEQAETVCSLIVKFLMQLRSNDGAKGKLWGPENNAQAIGFVKSARTISKKHMKTPEQIPSEIRNLLREFPIENQSTFKEICGMLHEACLPENTKTSLMDSKKFGLCVTPGIQWGMQMMIDHYDEVFEGIPSP